MSGKRTHFINPYTFVPLANRPVFQAEQPATHAILEENRFTGTIHCTLEFITPAVIPGKTEKGEKGIRPGSIEAYVQHGRLAIPGSRLRGHILNLMRALNSSPIQSFQDRMILTRVKDTQQDKVRKGFIYMENTTPRIQEVKDEILVAHPRRTKRDAIFNTELRVEGTLVDSTEYDVKIIAGAATMTSLFKTYNVSLRDLQQAGACKFDPATTAYLFVLDRIYDANLRQAVKEKGHPIDSVSAAATNAYITPADEAICYCEDQKQTINYFVASEAYNNQGVTGRVYYGHPISGSARTREFKMYMVEKGNLGLKSTAGRWVKFDSWSGQDGENRFRDLGGERLSRAHWNCYHVVNLQGSNLLQDFPLTSVINGQFDGGVEDMALLTKERQDKEERTYADFILGMKPLKAGMFVYFKTDGNGNITSIGRHYRYLYPLGSVKARVGKTNNANTAADCPVKNLSGWADDQEMKDKYTFGAMKSRLWVGMAMGPVKTENNCRRKKLRILSSQPPKQADFYLDGGYQDSSAKIRGRKFYWHDPKWVDPMWDNEDTKKGEHGFENHDPLTGDLWEQWSEAEVLWPTDDDPLRFKFPIRVMNLSRDELYLLLTALIGFNPRVDSNGETEGKNLGPGGDKIWCHKIGHARPFLGSAELKISDVEWLDLDKDTWLPALKDIMADLTNSGALPGWEQGLIGWQKNPRHFSDAMPHIKALRRIMNFNGAYLNLGSEESEARITYPMGQDISRLNDAQNLTWNCESKKQPKPFVWFGETNGNARKLPKAESGGTQALKVFVKKDSGNRGGGGHHPAGSSSGNRGTGGKSSRTGTATMADVFRKAGQSGDKQNKRR